MQNGELTKSHAQLCGSKKKCFVSSQHVWNVKKITSIIACLKLLSRSVIETKVKYPWNVVRLKGINDCSEWLLSNLAIDLNRKHVKIDKQKILSYKTILFCLIAVSFSPLHCLYAHVGPFFGNSSLKDKILWNDYWGCHKLHHMGLFQQLCNIFTLLCCKIKFFITQRAWDREAKIFTVKLNSFCAIEFSAWSNYIEKEKKGQPACWSA